MLGGSAIPDQATHAFRAVSSRGTFIAFCQRPLPPRVPIYLARRTSAGGKPGRSVAAAVIAHNPDRTAPLAAAIFVPPALNHLALAPPASSWRGAAHRPRKSNVWSRISLPSHDTCAAAWSSASYQFQRMSPGTRTAPAETDEPAQRACQQEGADPAPRAGGNPDPAQATFGLPVAVHSIPMSCADGGVARVLRLEARNLGLLR